MVYALIYAENADIVATYSSREEARRELAAFVSEHPELRSEIGLRAYKNGRPAGKFLPASTVLAEATATPG